MRTILYRRYGDPAEVLECASVPDLPAPGSREVLVRVQARPVHPGDLLGVEGRYRPAGSTAEVGPGGNRPGFEGAGVVEATGPDVDPALGLTPGRRVAFFPGRWAWGERAIVSVGFVTAVPDDVSDAIAAQLHVVPLTAAMLMRAAEEAGAAADGMALVLSAAGSAVARSVLALARRRGLHAVGVVRSAAGAAALRAAEPTLDVVTTADGDWRAQVRAAAGDRTIRAALDPVGGDTASGLFDLLGDGGTLVSYGDLSGEPVRASALAFSVRGVAIRGVSVGRWAGLPPTVRAADLDAALTLAREEPALFPVAATYDLADVSEAVAHARRPLRKGTVLLTSR